MADTKTLFHAVSNSERMANLLSQIPKVNWWGDYDLYKWEDQWMVPAHLEATIALRSHFEAHDDDVIIASCPKTGTTWLKALVSCILGSSRDADDDDDDPLAKNPPHNLIRTLEAHIYTETPTPDLSSMPSPRLFATHLLYKLLPEAIKKSKCKMVYITRNPKDTFVSTWHFVNTFGSHDQGTLFPIEEAFESFCNGIHIFGPFFDHVLEYWKESLRQPEKILFLKYEELKRNPREEVKKIASFLGRPFVNDEEADKVLWRCSIERLKILEVNKNGVEPSSGVANNSFFRLGIVGDWKNIFTAEMKEQLDRITHSKLKGSGLDLEIQNILFVDSS